MPAQHEFIKATAGNRVQFKGLWSMIKQYLEPQLFLDD